MYAQFRVLLNAGTRCGHRKVLTDTAVAAEHELVQPFFAGATMGGRRATIGTARLTTRSSGLTISTASARRGRTCSTTGPPRRSTFISTTTQNGGTSGRRKLPGHFCRRPDTAGPGLLVAHAVQRQALVPPQCAPPVFAGHEEQDAQAQEDGSLTVYAGGRNPGPDYESNWLPAPDGHFSLYIRAYWGEQGIIDGSWQPPKIEKRA